MWTHRFLTAASYLLFSHTVLGQECPANLAEQCVGPAPAPEAPTDITNYGNYLITNCLSTAPDDTNLAKQLTSKLQVWGPQISKVLDDVIHTRHGPFATYFKTHTNINPVSYIFKKISAGDNVSYGGTEKQPTLTCARDGATDPDLQRLWRLCDTTNPDMRQRPVAFHLKGTQTIGLCPRFFTLAANPPTSCPSNLLDLVQNQFGLFVHEAVHLYGDEPAGQQTIGGVTFGRGEERYNPRRAAALLASEQILNPQVRIYLALGALCLVLILT